MQQWSAVFAVSGTQTSLATSIVPKTLAFTNNDVKNAFQAAGANAQLDVHPSQMLKLLIPARPRIVFMAFPPLYIGSLTATFRALT